jgi:acyl carrier protein
MNRCKVRRVIVLSRVPEIGDVVLKVVELYGRSIDPELVGDDTKLMSLSGLALDSLEVFQLVISLEEEYGVDLKDVPREELQTLGRLTRAIQVKLAAQGGITHAPAP